MGRWIKIFTFTLLGIALVAISGAVGAFMIRNNDWIVVQIPVFYFRLTQPIVTEAYEVQLAWLLIAVFLGGVLTVFAFVVGPGFFRGLFRNRKQKRYITRLEKEVEALRRLPVEHLSVNNDGAMDLSSPEELAPDTRSKYDTPSTPEGQ